MEAVELAGENARRASLEINVAEGDLLVALPEELRGCVHLVVSNPPYIARADADGLPSEVRADPELALFGGTEIHRRLAGEAREWLRPGGRIAVEIGDRQGADVVRIFRAAGYESVQVHPDLTLRDRVVTARRPTAQ
jgi:release factor glutamine methyltransferase